MERSELQPMAVLEPPLEPLVLQEVEPNADKMKCKPSQGGGVLHGIFLHSWPNHVCYQLSRPLITCAK